MSRGLDFRNDTEVHVIARGKSEESGLEYGATIEFEADTNNTLNTDETWIFLRGGWGEIRLGDEDGVVDNSVVGGQTLAAGTGGIDGSDAVIAAAPLVFLFNSNDATKVRYYTPSFGGLSLGVSYTPTQENLNSGANNGQFFANKDGALAMEAQNIFEGAIAYDGDFGGVGVLASVVGLYGELKNDAEDAFDDDKWWGVQTGANIDLWGFKFGGSVAHDEVGNTTREFYTARHRGRLWPNWHLDHLRADLQHQPGLRRGDGDRRRCLQPGLLGRLRDRPGPGAGGRREQVRQRQHDGHRHRRQGRRPRWAASAWRSDRSVS